MLGPSHVKCEFNTWADEFSHPDPNLVESRVYGFGGSFLPHP